MMRYTLLVNGRPAGWNVRFLLGSSRIWATSGASTSGNGCVYSEGVRSLGGGGLHDDRTILIGVPLPRMLVSARCSHICGSSHFYHYCSWQTSWPFFQRIPSLQDSMVKALRTMCKSLKLKTLPKITFENLLSVTIHHIASNSSDVFPLPHGRTIRRASYKNIM